MHSMGGQLRGGAFTWTGRGMEGHFIYVPAVEVADAELVQVPAGDGTKNVQLGAIVQL